MRRVGIDYHIEVAAHYYSVPHRFARAEVDARLTARTVEIFLKGERIAAHMRMSGNHKHTAVPVYQRVPKLFADLALARGDGRIMQTLTAAQLLILDDWGLDPLDVGARRNLYEILQERYGRRSPILTSQGPVAKYHEIIGSPRLAGCPHP